MIEIINPLPVFDKDHNVISFKYNDGLVVHDCLTNTLNVSYLIVRDLISNSKTIENVLLDLKEYFGTFSDIKCHDRDFLIEIVNNLLVIDNLECCPNDIFWVTKDGEYVMSYDHEQKILFASYYDIWSIFLYKYGYDHIVINILITNIPSHSLKLDIIYTGPTSTEGLYDYIADGLKLKVKEYDKNN